MVEVVEVECLEEDVTRWVDPSLRPERCCEHGVAILDVIEALRGRQHWKSTSGGISIVGLREIDLRHTRAIITIFFLKLGILGLVSLFLIVSSCRDVCDA